MQFLTSKTDTRRLSRKFGYWHSWRTDEFKSDWFLTRRLAPVVNHTGHRFRMLATVFDPENKYFALIARVISHFIQHVDQSRHILLQIRICRVQVIQQNTNAYPLVSNRIVQTVVQTIET